MASNLYDIFVENFRFQNFIVDYLWNEEKRYSFSVIVREKKGILVSLLLHWRWRFYLQFKKKMMWSKIKFNFKLKMVWTSVMTFWLEEYFRIFFLFNIRKRNLPLMKLMGKKNCFRKFLHVLRIKTAIILRLTTGYDYHISTAGQNFFPSTF